MLSLAATEVYCMKNIISSSIHSNNSDNHNVIKVVYEIKQAFVKTTVVTPHIQ